MELARGQWGETDGDRVCVRVCFSGLNDEFSCSLRSGSPFLLLILKWK